MIKSPHSLPYHPGGAAVSTPHGERQGSGHRARPQANRQRAGVRQAGRDVEVTDFGCIGGISQSQRKFMTYVNSQGILASPPVAFSQTIDVWLLELSVFWEGNLEKC